MNKLLSRWIEFVLIIGLCYGTFIYWSSLWLPYWGTPIKIEFGGSEEIWLLCFELIAGALAVITLTLCGYRMLAWGFTPTWPGLWHGLLLFIAASFFYYLIYYLTWFALRINLNTSWIEYSYQDWQITLLLIIVNSFFEEVFVTAYVIRFFSDRAAWAGIVISTVIRFSYHTYQGPIAIASILPVGILFAWYYHAKRDLVPLIVAHTLMNLIFLLYESLQYAE